MSISQTLGTAAGDPYKLECDKGEYVIAFDAHTGAWIGGVGIKCSNNKTLGPVNRVTGLKVNTVSSKTGFSGYDKASAGVALDNVTLMDATGKPLAGVGGPGGNPFSKWTCPKGQLITGVSGTKYDDLAHNRGVTAKFHCGKPSNNTLLWVGLSMLLLIIVTVIIAIVLYRKKHKKPSKALAPSEVPEQ